MLTVEHVSRAQGTKWNTWRASIINGWSAEEILRQHSDLRPEQVYAALTYFYDHHDLLVQELEATAFAAERERLKQPITRAELLKRRADQGS